jgi:rubrerythrin
MKNDRQSKQHSSSKKSGNGAKMEGRARSMDREHSAELDSGWLMEFLSEMLTVERGGVMLYEKALRELEHDDLSEQLEEFLDQTKHHVELCEEMLKAAGGDPEEMSPGAEAAQSKAEGLLAVKVPEHMADLNNIENLVLAETKDHWNWEMLTKKVKLVKDKQLKALITDAVREVGKQERDHLDWNTETLTELADEMSRHPADDAMAEDEDREEERY